MKNPINLKDDGHIENDDTDQAIQEMTQEQFNAIESGDTVFLKDGAKNASNRPPIAFASGQ